MKLQSKPSFLKHFGLFKFEKIDAQNLVFDRCAKINTCEINRCLIHEIKSRKCVRIRYSIVILNKPTFYQAIIE